MRDKKKSICNASKVRQELLKDERIQFSLIMAKKWSRTQKFKVQVLPFDLEPYKHDFVLNKTEYPMQGRLP